MENKNKGGRPLMFQTKEELEKKIEEYFKKCDETIVKRKYDKEGNVIEEWSNPYTITGLAMHLNTSRETLCEYGEKPMFVDIIKKAKEKCEECYERNALLGKYNPAFAIFAVKNHFNWKDKQEVEHGGTADFLDIIREFSNK